MCAFIPARSSVFFALCVALAIVTPDLIVALVALAAAAADAVIMWRAYQGAAAGIRRNTAGGLKRV